MKKIEEALRILGVIADTHKLFFAGAVTKDARAELAQLKENLRKIEETRDAEGMYFCPACYTIAVRSGGIGHKPNCWMKPWIGGE